MLKRFDDWMIDNVFQPQMDKGYAKTLKEPEAVRSKLPAHTPMSMAQFMLAGTVAFEVVSAGCLFYVHSMGPIEAIILLLIGYLAYVLHGICAKTAPVPMTVENPLRKRLRYGRLGSIALTWLCMATLFGTSAGGLIVLPLFGVLTCSSHALYFMACRQPGTGTARPEAPPPPPNNDPWAPA